MLTSRFPCLFNPSRRAYSNKPTLKKAGSGLKKVRIGLKEAIALGTTATKPRPPGKPTKTSTLGGSATPATTSREVYPKPNSSLPLGNSRSGTRKAPSPKYKESYGLGNTITKPKAKPVKSLPLDRVPPSPADKLQILPENNSKLGWRKLNTIFKDVRKYDTTTTRPPTRALRPAEPLEPPEPLRSLELPGPLEPEIIPPRPPPLVFKQALPDLEYEERVVEGRNPVKVRIYHPDSISSPSLTKIIYLPSSTISFFPPPEKVISLLSKITSSTIITLAPTTTVQMFPQSLDNILRVHDYFNTGYARHTQTAILSSGIAASIATSVAVTEPSIKALGIWGGALDLTTYSERVTAWNRSLEKWDHFPEKISFPVPKKKPRLGMSEEEFIALRRYYYPNPERWADPFASPHLFFRGAGVEFSRQTMQEIFGRAARGLLERSDPDLQIDWGDGNHIYPRRQYRIWHQYPPRGRDSFPNIRIVLPAVEDKDDVTAEQGIGFVDSARICLAEWLYKCGSDREDAKIDADMMVTFDRILAGDTWVDEVTAMGNWFKWVFDKCPIT